MSNHRLYVGNIPWEMSESDLRDFFAQYEVVDAKVIMDKDTNRSRGFGFVEVKTDLTVSDIIDEMDGRDFGGRQIRVSEAQKKNSGGGRGGERNDRHDGGRPRPRNPKNGTQARARD